MNNRIVAVEKKDGKKCHDCLSTPLAAPSGEVTRGIPAPRRFAACLAARPIRTSCRIVTRGIPAPRLAGVPSVHPILLSSKIVGWGLAVRLARQGGDLVSDTIG